MKKIFLLVTCFFLLPSFIKAIDTSASSAILMDIDSKRILYSKNIHDVRSVASISKIMTAVVVLENTDLKDKVTIGSEITKAYGSAIYIKEGEILTVEDLLYGLMLRSGNDAALSLATYTSGSVEKFVQLMNEKASKIGMKDSEFNNPSGLDQEKGNYSSAYDMALLMSYAYKNNKLRKIIQTKEYKLKTNKNVYIWYNKNKLLKNYKYATGGKTGYTEIARRTLVNTASKNNTNLVAVTLNDGNDFMDHENLFEYGFSNYRNYQVLKKGEINLYDEKYYKDYTLYLKNDFSYLLDKNETNSININYELEKKFNFKNNSSIGKVSVYLGDKKIYTDNIYIKKKNTFSKKNLIDKIKEFF